MSAQGPVLIKGMAIRSTLDWIQRTQGRPAAEQILSRIDQPLRDQLAQTKPSDWRPIELFSALLEAYVHSSYCPQDQIETQLKTLGTYIAESNLTTVYRVMLAFVKPDTYARHIPRLWGEYFKGLTATVEYTDTHAARNLTSPLNGCKYLSPCVVGWTELAYRHVGARYADVRELNFSLTNPAPDVFDIRIEWR